MIPSTLVISLAPFVARKMSQDEGAYEEAMVGIFRAFAALSLTGAALIALVHDLLFTAGVYSAGIPCASLI